MENRNNILKVPINIPLELIKNHDTTKIISEYSTNNISINNIDLNKTELSIDLNNDIEYIDNSIFKLDGLPSNLMISTISATGKINCKMLLENIDKYIKLSNDGILSIKYGGKIRSLEKKRPKNRKKSIRSFENQLTMEVRVFGDKKINVKIFKNGSFQMTGCKSIVHCNIVLNHIINRFKNTVALVDPVTNKIVEYPFIEDIADENKEIKVYGFKIDMINSNFCVNYYINRDALFNILQKNQVNCRYEPCIHACVNIKFSIPFDQDVKIVSIFVFQSGNIIITGARNKDQIIKSYDYIMDTLATHYNQIVKKDLINMLDNNDIKDILDELETLNIDEINEIDDDNIII